MAESLYDKMVAAGIDPAIAKTMAASAEKHAAKKTTTTKKGGKFFPGMAADKPKKFNGSHTYTAVCATCGSRTTKTRIAQIDPNKPLPSLVPVSTCESCIPFYRTLTQDDLITLILIKDNEDITLRMLSHKQQIDMARRLSPFDVIKGFKLEVDAPYEPEYKEVKEPEPVHSDDEE